MNLLLPFLMVIAGAGAAYAIKPKDKTGIKMLLTFSGAFLLAAVAVEYLPEIYESGDESMGAYLLLGVFIQIILEFFSKGAEHGHLHVQGKSKSFPWLLFVSLCIHAFLEGIPLQYKDTMVYGIAIHKLPVSFILTAFLISSRYPIAKIMVAVLFFASMSGIGTLSAQQIGVLNDYMLPIKSVVTGIVLHVSTTLILESSDGHKFNVRKVILMIAGAALAFLI